MLAECSSRCTGHRRLRLAGSQSRSRTRNRMRRFAMMCLPSPRRGAGSENSSVPKRSIPRTTCLFREVIKTLPGYESAYFELNRALVEGRCLGATEGVVYRRGKMLPLPLGDTPVGLIWRRIARTCDNAFYE